MSSSRRKAVTIDIAYLWPPIARMRAVYATSSDLIARIPFLRKRAAEVWPVATEVHTQIAIGGIAKLLQRNGAGDVGKPCLAARQRERDVGWRVVQPEIGFISFVDDGIDDIP